MDPKQREYNRKKRALARSRRTDLGRKYDGWYWTRTEDLALQAWTGSVEGFAEKHHRSNIAVKLRLKKLEKRNGS